MPVQRLKAREIAIERLASLAKFLSHDGGFAIVASSTETWREPRPHKRGARLREPLLSLLQACFGLRGARLRFGNATTLDASPYMLGHGESFDSIVTVSPKPLKRVPIAVP